MNDIIKWRRWFHKHPELSFSEYETSKFIKDLLDSWNVSWKGWGDTALVAEIGKGDRSIAIRTDMDALPVDEENDVPYRSKYAKRMHACGHDGHMAIVLGVIQEIKKIEAKLSKKIVFIFQPAEEIGEGAKFLVNEGVIDYYNIERIIGFHLFVSIPSGTIGARPGIIMAEGDKFAVEIRAKGSHGATPWLSHDVIAMGTSYVQTVFSNLLRRVSPLSGQVVLSIGKLNSGDAFNVIPQKLNIEGTIRSLSREKREEFIKELKDFTEKFISSLGGSVKIDINRVFPPVVNDEGLYNVLKNIVSDSNYEFLEVIHTTISEDFSFFTEKVPGIYFFIGIRNKDKGIVYPHHHPKFDIDEDMLAPSVNLITAFALRVI